jgi:asparagine synthase (glutamine-hydrolysing)
MSICGIVGSRDARPVDAPALGAMVSALAVRKDAASDSHAEPEAGLGAVSSTGTTSLWKSEHVWVACDADLSNRAELSSQLEPFPDKENLACLLGQVYLKRGTEFLGDLRGVFSLAIWDCRSKTLLLAVDRFGVKPLCYSLLPSAIVFASQPRGILASGRVEKRVNPEALVNYLNFTVVPAPLCAFQGIEKLPPGCRLVWRDGKAQIASYWEMRYPEDATAPAEELARELLVRMEEAVEESSRDMSMAHLGCFLSGGTDSSSVVGLLTRLKKSPANAVSIGFAEARFNESNYARIAAKHFGAQHIESSLGPQDAFRIIPQMVALYDEPFANSSVIPTFHCQALAREHGMNVMLAGDGGDELFGGNERYRTHQVYELYQKIPAMLRHGLMDPLAALIPSTAPGIGKVRRYIQSSNTPNPERYCRWLLLQYFPPEQILGPQMPFRNGHRDLLAVVRAHYRAAPAQTDLNRLLYVDVKMTLGDNDLPKVARAAELAGINVRFPYLDHPLADFSGRIPADLKVKGLEKRYLFKRATRDLLPQSILEKKKHGFGLPIGLWLKTDPKMRAMAEEVLRDPKTFERGYFQRSFIENTFAAMDRDDTPFYGDILWPFLMLELWHRRHVEGQP